MLRARCVLGVGHSCAQMADKAAFEAWLGVIVDQGTGVKNQLGSVPKTLLVALYEALEALTWTTFISRPV